MVLCNLKHTRYTAFIIIDTRVHQILKVTKYIGILQNSTIHTYALMIMLSQSIFLNQGGGASL